MIRCAVSARSVPSLNRIDYTSIASPLSSDQHMIKLSFPLIRHADRKPESVV